jgi:transcriptional regulator with XRE-family HTH domain
VLGVNGQKDQKALGDRISLLRRERALSQEALAELAGLHRTYVGSVERGERNPSFLNLLRLSRALDISVSELMGGL